MIDLKEKLCRELDDYAKKSEYTTQHLDHIQKLTDSIKNINKILILEEDMEGYSGADGYYMRGDYGHGNSYANRGEHFVRGHYSRGMYDDGEDYSNARGGRYTRRYSRGGDVIEKMQEMLRGADDRDRAVIERCIKDLND